VTSLGPGERVGVAWLGTTCGDCPCCPETRENLWDQPVFTGYTRDGGFASQLVADARYCFPPGETGEAQHSRPLL
jgi:alcohol dehydrogenase, propanol-preferring